MRVTGFDGTFSGFTDTGGTVGGILAILIIGAGIGVSVIDVGAVAAAVEVGFVFFVPGGVGTKIFGETDFFAIREGIGTLVF